MSEDLTQRVIDDYDKYKYFFRLMFNSSSTFSGMTDSLVLAREITCFNKVGYLAEDMGWNDGIRDGLDYVLPEVYSFDLVYRGKYPLGTIDFSSNLAAAEASGVEAIVTLIATGEGIPFVREYYDRQSPFLIYGGLLNPVATPEGWELTDGKCEHMCIAMLASTAEYPLTSKTLPAREAYITRWGEVPLAPNSYDFIRFILPDAIERANTIETDAVIEALESTSIETTSAKNFVFTESHDVRMGVNPNNPDADYMLALVFQWQNGDLVPFYPKKIMEEAGATYTFPEWPGPWDNQ